MRRAISIAILAVISAFTGAGWADEAPEVVAYEIRAALDADAKTLTGEVRVSMRNSTRRAMRDVALHLYANAFRDEDTLFLRQVQRDVPGAMDVMRASERWGWIDLQELHDEAGHDLLAAGEMDETVFRAPLDRPVRPGDRLTLQARFVLHIPKGIARLGYTGNHYLIAQWFPKLGVFTDAGWHCKPYGLYGEFFSDFGTYDVTLRLPRTFVIGATGSRAEHEDHGDGTQTVRYRAEGVHDFAWTASPDYVEASREVGGVQLRLLYLPWHEATKDRVLTAAAESLAAFSDWFGAYPYPELTVVDAPLQTTGMEYPMLITTAGMHWFENPWSRAAEITTIHEMGHQWWYGLIATDEATHAWMDEGVNTYWTGVLAAELYGADTSALDLGPFRIGERDVRRLRYSGSGHMDPVATPAPDFYSLRSYARMTYSKTALALDTLEGMLGRDTMRAVFGTYARRYRFKHPVPEDLFTVFREETGRDLTWFWHAAFEDDTSVDYAVMACSYREVPDADPELAYANRVEVRRDGDLMLPVRIRIDMSDGSERYEEWDGGSRWWRAEFTGSAHVVRAVVDPDHIIALDTQPMNNVRLADAAGLNVAKQHSLWALIGAWLGYIVSILA